MVSEYDTVSFLCRKESYPHEVSEVIHLETHISHVFLAGVYAYKLKKAVTLPFLDFSTLPLRKEYTLREFELNTRYAPELYLGVEELSYNGETLSWNDKSSGDPVAYLLKMHRFEESHLGENLFRSGTVTQDALNVFIDRIAAFHKSAVKTPQYFSPSDLEKYFIECFEDLPAKDNVGELRQKVFELISRYRELMLARKREGFVRHVHGDLHPGNICLFHDKLLAFDGVEFLDEYACTDTWADIAFLIMDLSYHRYNQYIYPILNRYLEQTGDYAGLRLLPLFVAYRALVRAKVSSIRLRQQRLSAQDSDKIAGSVRNHVQFANKVLHQSIPSQVILIGGFSGSGKSSLGREIASCYGFLHLRSDVVRKQLAGCQPRDSLDEKFYTPEFSRRAYKRLYELAEMGISLGYHVVIDAVHGDSEQRDEACRWARSVSEDPLFLWCEVPQVVAEQRLKERQGDASDADADILRLQMKKLRKPQSGWRSVDMSKDWKVGVEKLLHHPSKATSSSKFLF